MDSNSTGLCVACPNRGVLCSNGVLSFIVEEKVMFNFKYAYKEVDYMHRYQLDNPREGSRLGAQESRAARFSEEELQFIGENITPDPAFNAYLRTLDCSKVKVRRLFPPEVRFQF